MAAYDVGSVVMGGWRVVRSVGRGASGEVYEVEKPAGTSVARSALKVVSVPSSDSEISAMRSEGMDEASIRSACADMANRLLDEVSLLASLGHPHVVRYQDHAVVAHVEDPGCDVLMRMEFLGCLTERLKHGPLAQGEVVRLGCELADALAFCHKRGIVHRDVKPQNVFVDDSGHYKLGDFGVSRVTAGVTMTLSQKGTPPYMAPELARGGHAGPAVDVYALGTMLYQLLNAGRLPFYPAPPAPISFHDRQEAQCRRLAGEIPPPVAGVDPVLMELVLRACAFDQAARPTSAELRDGLQALGSGTSPSSEVPPPENGTEEAGAGEKPGDASGLGSIAQWLDGASNEGSQDGSPGMSQDITTEHDAGDASGIDPDSLLTVDVWKLFDVQKEKTEQADTGMPTDVPHIEVDARSLRSSRYATPCLVPRLSQKLMLDRPLILLTDAPIPTRAYAKRLLESVDAGDQPLVVIAPKAGGVALDYLLRRHDATGGFYLVQTPGHVDAPTEMVKDLCAILGASPVDASMVKQSQSGAVDLLPLLGHAESVVLDAKSVTFIGGHGKKEDIHRRLCLAMDHIEDSFSEHDHRLFEERIAALKANLSEECYYDNDDLWFEELKGCLGKTREVWTRYVALIDWADEGTDALIRSSAGKDAASLREDLANVRKRLDDRLWERPLLMKPQVRELWDQARRAVAALVRFERCDEGDAHQIRARAMLVGKELGVNKPFLTKSQETDNTVQACAPKMQSMATFAQEACEEFLRGHPRYRDLFRDNPKLRVNLRIPRNEKVYLIRDNTLLSHKEGFAITEKGLYCYPPHPGRVRTLSWYSFVKDYHAAKLEGSETGFIYIGSGMSRFPVAYHGGDSAMNKELFALYKKLIEHAARRHEAGLS